MNRTGYELVICPECQYDYVRVSIGLGCLPCGSCGGRRMIVKDLYEAKTGYIVDVDRQKVIAAA